MATVQRQQVLGDDALAGVLPPAAEDEGDVREVDLAPDVDRPHLDVDAAPLKASTQRDDVAEVAVDVHVVGIEVRDHHGPAHATTELSALPPTSSARIFSISV